MAKGLFPENHRNYAGVLFHALADKVLQTCNEADLVISIGYDPVELLYEDWMPRIPLIHIGETAAEIDKEKYQKVVDWTGDIKKILNDFIDFDLSKKSWDSEVFSARKKEMFSNFVPKRRSFGPLAIIHDLRKILPEEGILTVDVGAHLHLIGQMWTTPAPEKLLMTNGWSSMGFAIPAAMAAKLCNQEIPVVALMGDGGFLMTVGELATAKRLNLNIIFVVIYDNSLSLIRIKQGKKNYNNSYGTQLETLQSEATNHYFGVPVIRANNYSEYKAALKKGFSAKGPVVIEVCADAGEYDALVLKT